MEAFDEDFAVLVEQLPAGWREQVRTLGAVTRQRKMGSPELWLRLVLLHGGLGLSQQATAAALGLLTGEPLTDVAVFKQFEKAGPFLAWAVGTLLRSAVGEGWPGGLRATAVDGSWVAAHRGQVQVRLDWAVDLATLQVTQIQFATRREGESLTRFEVAPGEVLLADRAFGRVGELAEVVDRGGAAIVRWGRCSSPCYDRRGERIDLLEWVQTRVARGSRVAWLETGDGRRLRGRLCAVRLSPEATERARKKARRVAQKKGREVEPETLAWAEWVVLFTTTTAQRLTASEAVTLYRARWQVELAFKRLKSLLAGAELRVFRPEAAQRWLLAKMLYALLLQACAREAGAFSPGGASG